MKAIILQAFVIFFINVFVKQQLCVAKSMEKPSLLKQASQLEEVIAPRDVDQNHLRERSKSDEP